MKKSKVTLQQLVEKIDWMMIAPKYRSATLDPESVAVGFYAQDGKHPENINRVRIRFGSEVLKKLKWETGDKICVFQDPDHLLTFKLVKTEAGSGYKLSQESKCLSHAIQFTWNHKELPLEERKSADVNYHIHKNSLIIFKIGEEEEIPE